MIKRLKPADGQRTLLFPGEERSDKEVLDAIDRLQAMIASERSGLLQILKQVAYGSRANAIEQRLDARNILDEANALTTEELHDRLIDLKVHVLPGKPRRWWEIAFAKIHDSLKKIHDLEAKYGVKRPLRNS